MLTIAGVLVFRVIYRLMGSNLITRYRINIKGICHENCMPVHLLMHHCRIFAPVTVGMN